MISSIRHLNNEPITGRAEIAVSLELGHVIEASIRQLYRVMTKFKLPILKNKAGEIYLSKDDVCFFRSSLLSGKEKIADFLKIGMSTLQKYMKEDPNIPIYAFQITSKNVIAHWYVNFLLSRSHRGNFVEFISETRCDTCGKYLFIFPGPNFRQFSYEDNIDEAFMKEYISRSPICPICKEAIYPPDCHHRILNTVDFQR